MHGGGRGQAHCVERQRGRDGPNVRIPPPVPGALPCAPPALPPHECMEHAHDPLCYRVGAPARNGGLINLMIVRPATVATSWNTKCHGARQGGMCGPCRLRRHVVGHLERELGWACAPWCVRWMGVCAQVCTWCLSPPPLRSRSVPLIPPWVARPARVVGGDLCMGAVSVCVRHVCCVSCVRPRYPWGVDVCRLIKKIKK